MSLLRLVAPSQECVVCGGIYVDGEEATTAFDSPSGAQTWNMGETTSRLKVDKGKNSIGYSPQVCGGI